MARGAKQTIVVKEAVARTREAAKKIARKFADRLYTSRFDEARKEWRFRQRPPSCFVQNTYGQKCIRQKGVEKGVCIVYATLKKGAKRRASCK